MRFKIIYSVFRKELTEMLRNRRSLMIMFGVPVLLYPLLTIAVAGLAQSKRTELNSREVNVVLRGRMSAPKLTAMMEADDSGVGVVRLRQVSPLDALKAGVVDAIIEIPPKYEIEELRGNNEQLKITVDRSRTSTATAEKKLDKIISDYQQWIVEQRLADHNLPLELARTVKPVTTDIATSGQTFGLFMGRTLPVLLLLMGMLGAFYPALNATTTERELGTLETLLVTPTTRGELLTGKALLVFLSGLLTAALNMVSMSLVIWRMLPQLAKIPGLATIDPWALTLSFVAAIPTLIFFSALVLMVGMLARNMREANAFATPVMLIPISSMLIGIAEPATTTALLLTPVANTTIIIQNVMTGHFRVSEFVLAFVSSSVYAALVLSLAGRLFTNEQLVNPAWEPLSFKIFSRRRGPRRYPAVDEALMLFAVTVLLTFYVAPGWAHYGLLPLLVMTEVALLASPAVVFGWLGRYRWREVFSLRRPTWNVMVGAAMIALGLIPLVNLVSWAQQNYHILAPNEADLQGMNALFEPALQAHPVLVPVVLGLLAGLCEELLFRGPIQSALIRRLPVWGAIVFGGFLFAAAHMDLSGTPVRMALGILLGWVVWRTGSIFPAMLLHATYDGVQVGWAAYQMLHGAAADSVTITYPLAEPGDRVIFGCGLALLIGGWVLIRLRRNAPHLEWATPINATGGVDGALKTSD